MSLSKILIIPIVVFLLGFMSLDKSNDFSNIDKEPWALLDSLEKIRQSKLLYEKSDALFQDALKDKDYALALKALTYKLRAREYREENPAQKNYEELASLIENSDFPLNQILASYQAELLQNYYQRQHYKIEERKLTNEEIPEQLNLWTKENFIEKITELHLYAIEHIEQLNEVDPISYQILYANRADKNIYITTSLYYILHKRAMNWYTYNDFGDIDADVKDLYTNPILFAPIKEFTQLRIDADKLLNKNNGTIFLLKNMLVFLGDKNEALKTYYNIERLKWAHSISLLNNKDQLLLESYDQFYNQLETSKAKNLLNAKRAEFYQALSNSAEWAGQHDKVKFRKLALSIADSLLQKNDTAYWKNEMQRLKNDILDESFSAEIPEHSFPNVANLVKVNFKNKNVAHWQLYKFDTWQENTNWHNDKLVLESLKDGEMLFNGKLTLNNSRDHFPHSMEFILPALSSGNYILALSDSNVITDSSDYSLLHFNTTNIGVVHRKNSKNSALEWVLRDAKSGTVLKGAEVQVYFREYNYQTRKNIYEKGPKFISNQEGLCSWLPGNNYRGNIYIDVTFKDEKLEKLGPFYYSTPHKAIDRPIINIFTDRSIYRPGQDLHFKAIAVQPNNNERELKTGWKQDFILLDANYQEIDKVSLKSDEYGTFNATFRIPESGLNGNYRIKTDYGTQTFKVEAYQRPKFEIELLPLEGFVKLGDSILIKGKAISFSGVPIQKADLKYNVKVVPKYLPYYSAYPTRKFKELSFGKLKIDTDGSFQFKFLADADEKTEFLSYKVEVSITDISGETQSTEKTYTIGKQPFNIQTDIATKIIKNDAVKWEINPVNSSNENVPAMGKLKVYLLESPEKTLLERNRPAAEFSEISEQEFKKNWPWLVYKNENDLEKRKKIKLVFETEIKGKTEITPKFLKQLQSGLYKVEISLWGASDKPIEKDQYFTLFDLESSKLPIPESAFFHLSKSNAQVGEDITLFIGSGYRNATFDVLIIGKDSEESSQYTLSNEIQKINIPVKKTCQGNFTIAVSMIRYGRKFTFIEIVTVPYDNKQLKLELETKRSTLLPGNEEEWTVKISDEKGKPVSASLLASMYDESLDKIHPHSWNFSPWPNFTFYQFSWSALLGQKNSLLSTRIHNNYSIPFPNIHKATVPDFESLYFNRNIFYSLSDRSTNLRAKSESFDGEIEEVAVSGGKSDKVGLVEFANEVDQAIDETDVQAETKIRSNFAETAFFFSSLESDESGKTQFKFTLPDAITRWKFQALAHSKSLQYGMLTESFEARKELMIEAQPLRFLRQGDSIVFKAKVTNLADKIQLVTSSLDWVNPFAKTELTNILLTGESKQEMRLAPGEIKNISWAVKIPKDFDQPLMYRLKVNSESYTDGEEKLLPVLKNNIALSKSYAFQINEKDDLVLDAENLIELPKKARITSIELEINPNPHWYIIQALPYLSATNFQGSYALFNHFYAQSISAFLASSSPDIRLLFQSWGDALKSPLQRGESEAINNLNNTPWLRDALNDEKRMKNISRLFDINKLDYEMKLNLKELLDLQSPNGGWPWISSMPDNRFITQKIVAGFARLIDKDLINIKNQQDLDNSLQKAIKYLDQQVSEQYERIMKLENKQQDKQQISALEIQYLLLRSSFSSIEMNEKNKPAYDYFFNQAEKYWANFSLMLRAQIALIMHRNDKTKTANLILESLKQNSLNNPELGTFWKNEHNPYWYHSPIETHVAILEAIYEIDGKTPMIREMQKWLLNEKRTAHWGNVSATADACYAFLLDNEQSWIQENRTIVSLDGDLLKPSRQNNDGSGAITFLWNSIDEINEFKGKLAIKNDQKNLVWGAIKVNYESPLEAVEEYGQDLKVSKEIFVQNSASSKMEMKSIKENTPKIGDEIWVRLTIVTERNFDFVHLKDLRAAGTEPGNVLSGGKWKAGLYFYNQVDDEAAHYFIPDLRKGTHVIEYPLYVASSGEFSSGPANIQCMYAVEFEAYSNGETLKIGD